MEEGREVVQEAVKEYWTLLECEHGRVDQVHIAGYWHIEARGPVTVSGCRTRRGRVIGPNARGGSKEFRGGNAGIPVKYVPYAICRKCSSLKEDLPKESI